MTSQSYRPRKQTFSQQRPQQLLDYKPMSYSNIPSTTKAPHLNHSQVAATSKSSASYKGEQQQTHLRRLYEQKQRAYKLTIQQLTNQNESLKLKHKQALMRISHLHGKLKMFLTEEQINSDAVKIVAEQAEKNYKEMYETMRVRVDNTVGRHQQKVRQLLEQYGCSWEESSLENCRNEGEVVEFLVKRFNQKADVLRKYEAEMREKLETQRDQYHKLQDSVRNIVESNELYQLKESKHKQKMDQVRAQWVQVCQKLARKQLDSQHWQSQNYQLRKRIQQLQLQLSRLQLSCTPSESPELRILHTQIADLTNRVTDYNLKYQQVCAALEETQLAIEEMAIKEKMREDEFDRVNREAVRWKERYEWLEKERGQSLQIIERENQRLRDELFRDGNRRMVAVKQDYVSPLEAIKENNMSEEYLQQQYYQKPYDEVDQMVEHTTSKVMLKRPKVQEQDYEYEPQSQPPIPKPSSRTSSSQSKRIYKRPQLPTFQQKPQTIEYQNRLKKIQSQLAKRGIQIHKPSGQRLQDLIHNFESTLQRVKQKYPQTEHS